MPCGDPSFGEVLSRNKARGLRASSIVHGPIAQLLFARGQGPADRGTNMKRLLPIVAATAAITLWPAPGLAQDAAGDKVNTVIVYGDDQCQESTADELVICVRLDEGERYRIPEALRQSDDPANQAWANRVKSFERSEERRVGKEWRRR